MNKSLRLKIMSPIILIVIVLMATIVISSLTISSGKMQEIVDNKGIAISKIAGDSLVAAIEFREMDSEAIPKNLKSLKKDEDIVFVQVKGLKNEAFGEIGEKYTLDNSQKLGEQVTRTEITVKDKRCALYASKIIKADAKNKEAIAFLYICLSLEKLDKSNSKISAVLISIGMVALILIGLLGFLIIGRIIKPLIDASNIMEEIASGEGDLTVRLTIDTYDEIGKLTTNFNNFIEKISTIMVKVKEIGNDISHASEEVASGSEDLARRTNEQAVSITETSTTMEEFTSLVKQNSRNSEDASHSLAAFDTEIKTKQDLMNNVTSTMKEIDNSSKKIDSIINVINDISFQTNLLALNAAVEAARAGEAGRGFAVVAAEVRNLAQKTAESSKTIQEIVSRNVESTKKGMELVNETSRFFSDIIKVMGEIVAKIGQITESSREQANGVEQINTVINELDNAVNQNAKLVDKWVLTGKGMKNNVQEMQDLVGRFNL